MANVGLHTQHRYNQAIGYNPKYVEGTSTIVPSTRQHASTVVGLYPQHACNPTHNTVAIVDEY